MIRQAVAIGLRSRSEAAVASAVVGGTDRSAARLCDGPEARDALGDRDADCAAPLAVETDAVRCRLWAAAGRQRLQHFHELMSIDRTAAQLEVDRHMIGNGRRRRQCLDIVRPGVDTAKEVSMVRTIPE